MVPRRPRRALRAGFGLGGTLETAKACESNLHVGAVSLQSCESEPSGPSGPTAAGIAGDLCVERPFLFALPCESSWGRERFARRESGF
eukprot:524400-Alexandrium_andersonii.AAC.2